MDSTPNVPQIIQLAEATDVHSSFIADVREGFLAERKHLPCKYLYDDVGSELFEEITRLPEYYLTRAETAALEAHAAEIMERVRPDELLEIGSGASRKTRVLLEAMRAVGGTTYVPFDISDDALRSASERLSRAYPWLSIHGAVGDFREHLSLVPRGGRRLIAFLGSTIGNLDPPNRRDFLRSVRAVLQEGDAFLLGVDLVKDVSTLEAAYDDASGVTARFSTNMLSHLNRELHGDVPVEAFEHVAVYNPDEQRIEISLRATRPVEARIADADLEVHFDTGEELHTEISSKFTPERIVTEFQDAELQLAAWWTDPEGRFGLALGVPR
jgi:L-histidine N-alpha-methyltransferase